MDHRSLRVDDDCEHLAVVSDLHATAECLPPLDAALSGLPGNTRVVVNGDLFNWGVSPAETVEWVRARAGDFTVRGNHDEWVFQEDLEGDFPPDTERGAYRSLSVDQVAFLRALPRSLEITWRGRTIRLMHGHHTPDGRPGDWRWPPDRIVAEFGDASVDLTVSSHTHYAFVDKRDGVLYANSGSAAFENVRLRMVDGSLHYPSGDPDSPENAGRRGAFLSVSEQSGQLGVEVVRFEYDRDAALRRMHQSECALTPDQQTSLMRDGMLDLTPPEHP